MKKKIDSFSNVIITLASIYLFISLSFTIVACSTKASRASANLSEEADQFKIVRQLTVINCIKGDVIFQMTGNISIEVDDQDNQLEVTVMLEDNLYRKHFVGLSDNVTYIVEDIDRTSVSTSKYTLYYNPDMWMPIDIYTEE